MRLPTLRMPKMPRRRFLIALAFVIIAGLGFDFNVYYHVKGWIRGDAYYKGMPTCYWADCLNKDHGTPGWLKSAYNFLGIKSSQTVFDGDIFRKDPEVAGVLLQLAAEGANSPEVREKALWRLSSDHKQCTPELTRICAAIFTNMKEELRLREHAGYVLIGLAADGQALNIDFASLLSTGDEQTKVFSAAVLWVKKENPETIGPWLVNWIEKYSNQPLKYVAMGALQRDVENDKVPFLLQISDHSNKWVRSAATIGLYHWMLKGCELTPEQEPLKSALARLKALAASDPDAGIRESARLSLEMLNQK